MSKSLRPIKADSAKGMERVRIRLNNSGEKDPIPFTHGGGEQPGDIPADISFYRLMEANPELLNKGDRLEPSQRALKGWTIQVDCVTYGVTVYVRIGFAGGGDPTLKVFVEDKDGIEKVGEWSK